MGFLKDKFKKRRETHENGYVSFTQDDLKEKMKANPANEKAYEFWMQRCAQVAILLP